MKGHRITAANPANPVLPELPVFRFIALTLLTFNPSP